MTTRSSLSLPLFQTAWLLTMISIPILRWVMGDTILPTSVMAGVLLQVCTVLAILQQAWGLRLVLLTTLLIVPLTWLVEYIGSTTGFPFGHYGYTNLLSPQLAGVPLLIPFAWLMMLPPSWAIAASILGEQEERPYDQILFSLISGVAMTVWDLYLDPQMVGWGYWVWHTEGGYFGIPWVNYVGWWGSASLVTWVALQMIRPPALPIQALLLIYVVTWLLQAIGQAFFWGQPGPALCGFLGMGSLILAALRPYWARRIHLATTTG